VRCVLHGRAAESARLRDIVAGAVAARGGAIVVRGEPGAGKTALLTDAAEQAVAQASGPADDVRVLWTQGIESESPLAFAALNRLVRPVVAHLDQIPATQARALRVALGQTPADGASDERTRAGSDDRLLVFVAVLSLLAEIAETQPVLCVVDDAQWLDSASGDALQFVARRLGPDRIAMLFGAREGDVRRFDGAGLPELMLTGLDSAAALALLTERAGQLVADPVRDELVRRTGGNPLALVELPDVLTDDQLAGQVRLPPQLPLTQGVESAFLDRARRLPDDAQTLLLVAAADDSGQAATIGPAAELLGVGASAWDAAERSGLVQVSDGALLLRHPLVRSAVYAAATTSQRRAAHQALASSLMAFGDVDRRTWHLALAASGPDDRLAEELDAVAERANRRAGHEAASAAFERAAALTASPDSRAAWLFAAATSSWQAGDGPRARALADEGRQLATDPILAADLDRLRGRLEWNVGSPQTGHAIVMAAARDVATTDLKRALELAMLGTTLATFGANPDTSGRTDETPYLPTLSASAPTDMQCLAAVLAGHQHILRGDYRDAAEELRQAFRLAESLPPTVDIWANLGIGAFHLGDDELTTRTFAQLLALGRTAGAMSIIITALTRLPCGQLPAGQWRAATASADEALAVARGMSSPALTALPLGWLTVLSAYRGEANAPATLAEVEKIRRHHTLGIVTVPVDDVVEWVKGILAANARDDSRAIHHLERISHPDIARLAAIDRLEAAVRTLRLDLAGRWVAELDSYGDAVGAGWASAAAEHGRALLGDGDDAGQHFERALLLHEGAGRPVDRARTELAYGESLRRTGRRVDARGHLRRALEVFDDVGAAPWAERAGLELRASGEAARKRDVTTTEDLTPQERQTALLVSQGLTNREVAARLFLSPRTVEYHLSNAYQKLGVRSRSELAQLALG
jgi:DNA-binding CsgD family transcriptional regulator